MSNFPCKLICFFFFLSFFYPLVPTSPTSWKYLCIASPRFSKIQRKKRRGKRPIASPTNQSRAPRITGAIEKICNSPYIYDLFYCSFLHLLTIFSPPFQLVLWFYLSNLLKYFKYITSVFSEAAIGIISIGLCVRYSSIFI